MLCRRGSNRRKQCITAKGTRQTTRAAQALVRYHGRHLAANRVIERIVLRSANRRLKRLEREGRKQKVLVKLQHDPAACQTECMVESIDAPSPKKRRVSRSLKTKAAVRSVKEAKAKKLERLLRKNKNLK